MKKIFLYLLFSAAAIFFASPVFADYGQVDDHSELGNDVANIFQDLGTGLSGNFQSVEVFGECHKVGMQACYLQIRQCDIANYDLSSHHCDTWDWTHYSDDQANNGGLYELQTYTWPASYTLDPAKYYFLVFEPTSNGVETFKGTTNPLNYLSGHIDLNNSYNLDDFYFNLIGISGPAVGPTPGSSPLGTYGLNISENWTCCFGSCQYPINMPAQLGWWSIGGAAVSRQLFYTVGSSTQYLVDFSSSTSGIIQIPTSTPFGFVNINYSLKIDGVQVATGSSQIEILAGDECTKGTDDYLQYCQFPCAGISTSTNPIDFDNLSCASRKFFCWLTKPDPVVIQKLVTQLDAFTYRFPLSPIRKAYDDLVIMSTGTQRIAPGTIEVPLISTGTDPVITSNNYYIGPPANMAASKGFLKFRKLETMLIWIIGVWIPCVAFTLFLIL